MRNTKENSVDVGLMQFKSENGKGDEADSSLCRCLAHSEMEAAALPRVFGHYACQ